MCRCANGGFCGSGRREICKIRGNMQQKIQSARRRKKPCATFDMGKLPPVEQAASPLSHGDNPPSPDQKSVSRDGNEGTVGTSCCGGSSESTSEKGSCGFAAGALILLIRVYQRWISPLYPPCCRFRPTCSHYAIEAFRTYGLMRGFALTVWRILRCNPWCRGGYDPVPPPKSGNKHDEV